MMSEKLLTFGQLCAIKREKMGLMIAEVEKALGYQNISNVERGINVPRFEARKKLIDFYAITDAELGSLKPTRNTNLDASIKLEKVAQIIRLIDDLIDSADSLKATGEIGVMVAKLADDNLKLARTKVAELGILDKLL